MKRTVGNCFASISPHPSNEPESITTNSIETRWVCRMTERMHCSRYALEFQLTMMTDNFMALDGGVR
jgi:hypothetical protein